MPPLLRWLGVEPEIDVTAKPSEERKIIPIDPRPEPISLSPWARSKRLRLLPRLLKGADAPFPKTRPDALERP